MTRFGPEADLCLAAVRACSSCSIDILSVSLKGYPYSRLEVVKSFFQHVFCAF